MKVWKILGLLFIALILLSFREGFDATDKIKNPTTWDAAELTRIRKLVDPESTLSDSEIRTVVGGFWSYELPARLPGEKPEKKGWSVETNAITSSDVSKYLNSVIAQNPTQFGTKRAEFERLLKAYYIDQGQSVFQQARNYVASYTSQGTAIQNPTDVTSTPTEENTTSATTDVKRPTTGMSKIRQDVSTYAGVPREDSEAVNAYVAQMQIFYDTIYLPNKKQPKDEELAAFADTVNLTTIPQRLRANFRPSLISVLDSYFATPPVWGSSAAETSGDSEVSPSTGETSMGIPTGSVGGGSSGNLIGPTSGTVSKGKMVWGPIFSGQGTDLGETGGDSTKSNVYPELLGGNMGKQSSRVDGVGITSPSQPGLGSILPSSASLGTDANSGFLPFSRQPGDMDVVPDPYRLAKNFSTKNYSSERDPVPFLTDFSAFYK